MSILIYNWIQISFFIFLFHPFSKSIWFHLLDMYVIIPDAFISMWLVYSLSTTKHSNTVDSRVKADKIIAVSTRCFYAKLVLHVQKSQTFFSTFATAKCSYPANFQPGCNKCHLRQPSPFIVFHCLMSSCLLVGPWPTAVFAHFMKVQMVVGHIWNLRLLEVECS